jgi:hypothetical protein
MTLRLCNKRIVASMRSTRFMTASYRKGPAFEKRLEKRPCGPSLLTLVPDFSAGFENEDGGV